MAVAYDDFLDQRRSYAMPAGIDIGNIDINGALFDHQRELVSWALQRGRAAVFADTGLGKTLIQLEWARHVREQTGCRVLILAPLAVADQTVREASIFGINDAKYLRDDDVGVGIAVTNYEMMHHFDPDAFGAVVLDESSILKSYTGAFRNRIIDAFQGVPYRLACTATPAPNDFTELGNHSEFLGIKSRVEMLAEYFINDTGDTTAAWRLKGHAESAFWSWVGSWARVVRMPSDLGFDDGPFGLPALELGEELVFTDNDDAQNAGLLFFP